MDLLTWAIIAFVVSLIAGGLGFTGVAGAARTVAKWLFAIFLVLAIVLLVFLLLGLGAVT